MYLTRIYLLHVFSLRQLCSYVLFHIMCLYMSFYHIPQGLRTTGFDHPVFLLSPIAPSHTSFRFTSHTYTYLSSPPSQVFILSPHGKLFVTPKRLLSPHRIELNAS